MPANQGSPDDAGERSGRVVVGVHGSNSSWRALLHATGIALDRGWDLEIVTAWPDADEALIHDVPGRYVVARGSAFEQQRHALASLDPVLACRVSTFLMNARPAQALLTRCADADLLVVGAGRPDERRDRLGVGAECVKAAPCPVAVVPEQGTEATTANATPGRRGHPSRGRSRNSRAGARANA
jgi:nucleotide-binding universal stress UspA family protein